MNLVNDEFGDKAIILSTKNNNGVVEVEASDNDDVIETHKKQLEENKNFSNVFMKEIDQKKSDKIKWIKMKGFFHNNSSKVLSGLLSHDK